MKIENERLLQEFREERYCHWCGRERRLKGALQPHHIFCRGMGGGGRLDVRINLISLCVPFVMNGCHARVHAGEIARFDLLAVVAAREDVMQDEIESVIYELRRWPKDEPLPERLRRFVGSN